MEAAGRARLYIATLERAQGAYNNAQSSYENHSGGAGCGPAAAETQRERFWGVRGLRDRTAVELAVTTLAVSQALRGEVHE